ncbi:deoxyguanosinetriphosphate triphosphohydrolase [Glacieibacterium frigidum]|uniref:Deoxyguanosinetriphosphate triphosphohydrolase-like protein n=1 Tax=Glacieibacterium frigidum TaxID=2593303 RepID=A0A552UG23_9SPHN|nr:deoxyguanosinetriphosphate triphosphohydrolase [Glacieibacterium frigidum]TRW17165.1 deoxyguanosinetriphosphate triphosphohydrolase [Glacieibacterium frigidum]
MSWATDPAASRGRRHPEAPSATRDAFQRDRDRIVHCSAFRRLRDKTQVFVAPDGDHFRVRLTHSLEVAQIARTLARALGLNEDLTEACALAHDLGHPPFGHSGEDALQAAMAPFGGFDHNAQTLRVLTRLEHRYPGFDGLNLSWETLEGLAKHNGPVTAPGWALAEIDADWPLELGAWPSLEAQIAALADDIAYDNHDLDDGLRAGLFDLDALLAEVPFTADAWGAVTARWPGVSEKRRLVPELVREQIGRMTHDLLTETRARLAAAGPASPATVRAAARPLAGFSAAIEDATAALKAFLRARMYSAPEVKALRDPSQSVVAALFAAFHADPARLPDRWRATLPQTEPGRARHIADFIAGMTDRYAIREHERVVGPSPLPAGVGF